MIPLHHHIREYIASKNKESLIQHVNDKLQNKSNIRHKYKRYQVSTSTTIAFMSNQSILKSVNRTEKPQNQAEQKSM